MRPRLLLNLALLLTIVLLIAIALFEPGLAPDGEQPLTPLQPAEIGRITIERPGAVPVALACRDGEWWLESPTALPAHAFRIGRILNIVRQVSYARYPVGEADPARLGLEPPNTILQIDGTELRFGDSEPLDQRRYVQIGGTIHLIDDLAYHHLLGGWPNFVSPRLLPKAAALTRLELPDLTLQRDEQGHWQINPPREPTPSADAINTLLQAWQTTEATAVQRYEPATRGEPLTLTLGDGRTLTYELIPLKEGPLLTRPDLGIAYQLAPSQGAALLKLAPVAADGGE